jgi:hypothetical protein
MPWTHMGSGGIARSFLASVLDGSERSVSLPGCFTPDKSIPLYSLDTKLGGPQSRSGRCRKMKNPLPVKKVNTARPIRSLSLYWLSYFGFINQGDLSKYKECHQSSWRNVSNVCIIKYFFISLWLNCTYKYIFTLAGAVSHGVYEKVL